MTLFAFMVHFTFFEAKLRLPMISLAHGDEMSGAVFFKGLLENGWYWRNDSLGAPLGAVIEYPFPDLFFLAIAKALVLVTRDWILSWNLMMVGSYPVGAMLSFLVLRRYGVSFLSSACASILFAFLPFHQIRLIGHTTLGIAYIGVPLAIVPALELLRERDVLIRSGRTVILPLLRVPIRLPALVFDRTTLGLLTIAVGTGLWGHMYFWFFAFLLTGVAAGVAAAWGRSHLPMLRGLLLCGASATAFVMQTLPYTLRFLALGRPPHTLREPLEAELYALKITHLILPMPAHRLAMFRKFRQFYDLTPLNNENMTAALGIVGAVGFLGLCCAAFYFMSVAKAEPRAVNLRALSVLNLVAVGLGTIGGFGSILSHVGFAQIRCYNRISVYIAFFSFFAIALAIDFFTHRLHRIGYRIAAGVIVIVVTVAGTYDQTSAGAPDRAEIARKQQETGNFVAKVEAALPDGAKVFQLPYMSFPEGGPVHALPDYSHFVPYLYSHKLRYSYGAAVGRRAAKINAQLAALPPRRLPTALVDTGYGALWLDRRGYADAAATLEASLRAELGEPLAIDPEGHVVVWSLGRAVHTPGSSADHDAPLLDRVFVAYQDGFYAAKPISPRQVAGRSRAMIVFENPLPTSQTIHFVADYQLAHPSAVPVSLHVKSSFWSETLDLATQPVRLTRELTVPPGTTRVYFTCNPPPFEDADPWPKAILLDNPHIEEDRQFIPEALTSAEVVSSGPQPALEVVAGFSDVEEPPERRGSEIPRWRWALGPETRIGFEVEGRGTLRVRGRYRSPFAAQTMTTLLDGVPLGPTLQPVQDRPEDIDTELPVEGGRHELTIRYALSNSGTTRFAPNDQRPLAIEFTSLRLDFAPDEP